jgi:uncharacterized cofD-like protein
MKDYSRSWSHGIHAVALGGGTGLANLLRGLKGRLNSRYPHIVAPVVPNSAFIKDLAAIVAMTDDGGSSGRLRKAFGMPPPGDLRNCMVALSDDDNLFSHLFQHRFSDCTGGLGDHSLGNLCIAALSQMTGDFLEAVELACELLAVRGRILPVTAANSTLIARMLDGSYVVGETALASSVLPIAEVAIDPPNSFAIPAALDAIASADLVTVGPGSLYTSLIATLLVEGITDALFHTSATRVYIANLMTQPNESLGLTLSEHIERIYEHARRPMFDYALVNTSPIPDRMLKSYSAQGAQPVIADLERIEGMGIRCITGDFIAKTGNVVRHSPELLAAALVNLPFFLHSPTPSPIC